jgi:hypothetical protein
MRKSHETIISEDFGEDSENMRLCPECKENYLDEGEELCYACRMELLKAEAKEKMTSLDQDMDFDEEFVVPTGKPEGEEVLMDNMEVLVYIQRFDSESSSYYVDNSVSCDLGKNKTLDLDSASWGDGTEGIKPGDDITF